jgi:glycine cleavage system H protein
MGDWKIPTDLKYAKSDEWFRVDGDVVTIGVSDYAQDQLNDIVYVEFKGAGESIDAGDSFGEVESVKAASELYSVISGEIVEINEELEDTPETINADPYGAGWLVKIKSSDLSALDSLMDADTYSTYCDER